MEKENNSSFNNDDWVWLIVLYVLFASKSDKNKETNKGEHYGA